MSKITRREFIKVGGATAAAAGATVVVSQGWKAARDEMPRQVSGANLKETTVKTTCALCSSGCGLEVRVVDGRAVKVEGNPLHPLNQGVCCLKGQTSLEALYSPERLLRPRLRLGSRGEGKWKEITWDEALSQLARRLSELRAIDLPHTVALVYANARGQTRAMLERFLTAYGSPNLIGYESLGEAAARQALFLSQGIKGLPVYDLNNAKYVMTFGGNLLESNRNVIGYLGSAAFMRRGRPERGKLVAVHPRLGVTGMKADEWVPIRPGTYAALALGMANVIINSDLYDKSFVQDFCFGFEDFEDESGGSHQGFKSLVLEQYTLERAARITGISTENIARLAGEFATNRPALAVLPTEPGEFASGNSLYTALAVHALNALVGSIDQPGGVLVQRFPQPADWPEYTPDAIAREGLTKARLDGAGSAQLPLASSALQNLPSPMLNGDPYRLNLLILYNANPVYDLPGSSRMVAALHAIPFVVSFASTLDESAAHSDLILPASTFLEQWGDDYLEGTGYAGVSLRQPVVDPLGESRTPGDVLLQVARLVDSPIQAALPFRTYEELVRYRLSGVDMEWETFAANGAWSEMVYFNAQPGSKAWSQVAGRDRLNAPQDGRFDLFSRELYALLAWQGSDPQKDLTCLPHFELPASPTAEQQAQYPLLLVSQSLITQSSAWQGIVPTLQECYGLQSQAKWESWVEMNPQVAQALGIREGDLVWVESASGRVQVHARLYEGLWPNAVFLPPGLGHHTFVRWGRLSSDRLMIGVNPNAIANTGTEPLDGMLVNNPVPVRIYKA